MTPEATVDAFIAAIEANDVDAAVAMTAAEISYENMPLAPIVGHDGLAATLRGFLAAVSAVEWRILRQWSVGGSVINERLDRFRIGDGWLELPVAGFFEVDDTGRITLWRDYFDMGSYVEQFNRLTAP